MLNKCTFLTTQKDEKKKSEYEYLYAHSFSICIWFQTDFASHRLHNKALTETSEQQWQKSVEEEGTPGRPLLTSDDE